MHAKGRRLIMCVGVAQTQDQWLLLLLMPKLASQCQFPAGSQHMVRAAAAMML